MVEIVRGLEGLPEALVLARIKKSRGVSCNETRRNTGEVSYLIQGAKWDIRESVYRRSPFMGNKLALRKDERGTGAGMIMWGMNYTGRTTPELSRLVCEEKIILGDIRIFLDEALDGITIESPFRGPEVFERGVLRYEHELKEGSTLREFEGRERIIYVPTNKELYWLSHNGRELRDDN